MQPSVPTKPLGRPAADIARVCRLLHARSASLARLCESTGGTPRQLERAMRSLESAAETLELMSMGRSAQRENKGSGFAAFFGKLVKDRSARGPDNAGLHGCSGTASVAEVLGFLSSTQKNGVLWVDTLEESYQIELERGAVVYATSNDPPPGFRLGEILVDQEVLTERELEAFVDRSSAAHEMLGVALVRSGVIERKDLEAALTHQVHGLFQRLFAAPEASYTFSPNVRVMENPDLRMNVTHLLLESARSLDESLKVTLGGPPGGGDEADEGSDDELDERAA